MGALDAAGEQVSTEPHGGMERVMGGHGGGVPGQKDCGERGQTSPGGVGPVEATSAESYPPSWAWKPDKGLLESVPAKAEGA